MVAKAEGKVVILNVFETVAEAARTIHGLTGKHHQMAHVGAGQKQLGRPVGLEDRLHMPALRIQTVFIAINQIGRLFLHHLRDTLEGRGRQDIVLVEEGDIVPPLRYAWPDGGMTDSETRFADAEVL